MATNSPSNNVFYLCVNHNCDTIGVVSSVDFSETYVSELVQAVAQNRPEVRSRVGELTIWTIRDKGLARLLYDDLVEKIKGFVFSKESKDVKQCSPEDKLEYLGLDPEETLLVYVPQRTQIEVMETADIATTFTALQRRDKLLSVIEKESISVDNVAGIQKAHNLLFTGRVDDRFGYPVALFDSNLAKLQHRLETLDWQVNNPKRLDGKILRASTGFLQSIRYNESETEYWSGIKSYLHAIFPEYLVRMEKHAGNEADKDSNEVYAAWDNYACCEVMREFDEGDASLKAAVWYAKRCASLKEQVKSSNLPCIIIGIVGNMLDISIAVCLEEVLVDNILHLRIRGHVDVDEAAIKLTLIASAVKDCALELRKEHHRFQSPNSQPLTIEGETWHLPCPSVVSSPGTQIVSSPYIHSVSSAGTSTGSSPDMPTLSLPYIHFAASSNASTVSSPNTSPMRRLEFKAKLGRDNEELKKSLDDHSDMRSLFLANYLTPESSKAIEVVVKFVLRYNADAHHLLAEHNYAPKLYACVPVIGGLQMIIMGRVKGKRMLDECDEHRRSLPMSFFEETNKALSILHDAGFVLGDLRDTSIMIVRDPQEQSVKPVLIDFDRTRKEKASYPSRLEKDLISKELAPDVRAWGPMLKKHDKWALAHLIELYCADEEYRKDKSFELRRAGGY